MSNCRTVVILSVAEAFEHDHGFGDRVTSAELAHLSDVVGAVDGHPGSDYADCLLADGTLVTCSRRDDTRTVLMMLPAGRRGEVVDGRVTGAGRLGRPIGPLAGSTGDDSGRPAH